jgi:hypothetical protein
VGRWIVKPSGRHPHGNLALLRELAGASVAAWVGLLVPAIEIIRFPERAVPAWADSSLTGRILREHSGQFAFCSRYLQASRLEQGALLARDASDARPSLAVEAARQVTERMEALDDEVLSNWLARWPDELERSWFDAPTGYKSDLFRFLGARREKASALWSEFIAAQTESEPPPATEEEP